MAQGAIIYRWGPSVRGREKQSLEVFGDSVQYFDDKLRDGRINGHEPYFSTNRDGGCWIVKGDLDELTAIQDEEAYQRLVLRITMLVEDWSAEVCRGGSADALSGAVELFEEVATDLS